MNRFEKYGFVMDEDGAEFKSVFKNNKFKKMHIDTYSDKPYMLFSRTIESDVEATFEDDRVILRKKDKTTILNILLTSIGKCMMKRYGNSHREFVFTVHNLNYKILAVN